MDVVGGTGWLWASEQCHDSVDVLFIDEAGQFSLANALAVSPAAASLVMLGDPQQLDQPLKGSHPIGAERSALGHLLGDAAVMPDGLGLFMDRTWRLHPEICEFTSEVFYAAALLPQAGNERQALRGVELADGEGIRFVAVAHEASRNDTDSAEEARAIADIVCDLLDGATWTDREGSDRPIGSSDILVITPYNAQRKRIGRELARRGEACAAVAVGTVDKFQGQEAPISIYSMATSRPEDAPRGMEFLYSLNRLNVATSRARCLALVVASPALVSVIAHTPRQMQLANALCRLVEVAVARRSRCTTIWCYWLMLPLGAHGATVIEAIRGPTARCTSACPLTCTSASRSRARSPVRHSAPHWPRSFAVRSSRRSRPVSRRPCAWTETRTKHSRGASGRSRHGCSAAKRRIRGPDTVSLGQRVVPAGPKRGEIYQAPSPRHRRSRTFWPTLGRSRPDIADDDIEHHARGTDHDQGRERPSGAPIPRACQRAGSAAFLGWLDPCRPGLHVPSRQAR